MKTTQFRMDQEGPRGELFSAALHQSVREGDFNSLLTLANRAEAAFKLNGAKCALLCAEEGRDDVEVLELLHMLKVPLGAIKSLVETCARRGQYNCLRFLIERHIYHDVKSDCSANLRFGPLHWAAKEGHPRIVQLLLKAGAPPATKNLNGETASALAIQSDNPQCLTLLLEAGVLPTTRDFRKNILLHFAARTGSRGCLQVLIERAPETVHLRNTFGETPLHCACKHGHTECARLLFEAHSRIDLADMTGIYPLHFAAGVATGESCVRLLTQRGACVNQRAGNGMTALHIAARKGFVDCVLELLLAGADVNGQDVLSRSTPAHLAAESGHRRCLELLIEHGAKLNMLNGVGNTPLHSAAQYGKHECIELILSHSSNVDLVNKLGNSPLHFLVCSSRGEPECVEQLLKAGASLSLRNRDNETPLQLAIKHRRTSMVQRIEGLLHGI